MNIVSRRSSALFVLLAFLTCSAHAATVTIGSVTFDASLEADTYSIAPNVQSQPIGSDPGGGNDFYIAAGTDFNHATAFLLGLGDPGCSTTLTSNPTRRGGIRGSWAGKHMKNLPGKDLVFSEKSVPGNPEYYVIRVKVVNQPVTGFYFQPCSDVTPTEGTIDYLNAYDFSDLGIAADAEIEYFEVWNLIPSDTISDPSGIGFLQSGGGGFLPRKSVLDTSPGATIPSGRFDPDIVYVWLCSEAHLVSLPFKLSIPSVNGGVNPGINTPFFATVRCEDIDGAPVNVIANTNVQISVNTGTGNLTGTLTGTIMAGTNTVTISGMIYDKAESGVSLHVVRTSGDDLLPGNSAPFTVIGNPATALWFASINGGNSPQASVPFPVVVQSLNAQGDPTNVSVNTNVRLTLNTGNGTLGGTLTATILAGTSSTTFTGVTYDVAESNVSLRVTRTGGAILTAANSASFTVLGPPATHLKFLGIDANFHPTQSVPFTVTVQSQDLNNNPAPVTVNTQVTLTRAAGTGTLGGTLTGTILAGTNSVTFPGVTYSVAESSVRLKAASATLTEDISDPFTVLPLGASGLGFVSINGGASPFVNAPFSVVIEARNQLGGVANVAADTVVTLTRAAGTGTIGGTLTATILAGSSQATFPGVTYSVAEPNVQLTVSRTSGDTLAPGTSDVFTVRNLLATQLVFVTINGNINPTVNLPFSVVVQSRDINNQPAAVEVNTVVTLTKNSGTGNFGGTLTGTLIAGQSLLTFNNVTYNVAESNVRLNATRTSGDVLTAAVSNPFTVNPPSGASLSITSVNGGNNPVVNVPFPVVIRSLDVNGNFANVLTATTVQLSLISGTGNLGGTLSGTIAAGTSTVTIPGVTYDRVENLVRIRATRTSGDNLSPANSPFFNVTAAPPVKLSFLSINSGVSPRATQPFIVRVQALDANNQATAVTQNTVVQLSRATGTGTLGGTMTATIFAGTSTANFNAVTYSVAESGVSITATRTSGDVLTPVTSALFTVLPAPASKLAFLNVNNGINPVVNTPFTITIETRDAFDVPVAVVGDTTVTITRNSGTGTLSGTLTGTIIHGTSTLTIPGLLYNVSENNVSLKVSRTSGDNLSDGISSVFTVNGPPPTHLSITSVNNGTSPTEGLPFPIQIQAQDGNNAAAAVLADTVITLSLTTGTGTLGGSLTGTMAAGTNTLTLNAVTYDTAESGVSVTATRNSGDNLTPGTSAPFSVISRPAVKIAITDVNGGINPVVGSPFSILVEALDANDIVARVNTATNFTISVLAGSGSVSGAINGTIPANSTGVTLNGLFYSVADTGVILRATPTGGSSLAAGNSVPFTVDPAPAIRLAIPTINNNLTPTAGVPFPVVVQARDFANLPANVQSDTAVVITVLQGTGNVGGTITGTIPAGQNTITLSAVTYDTPELSVRLHVERTSGDVLTGGDSGVFNVQEPPPVKLVVLSVNGGNQPTVNTDFPVVIQAQSNESLPARVLVNTTVTLTRNSGTGTLSGTLSGVITAGNNTITLNTVRYNTPEPNVSLLASVTVGNPLTAGASAMFRVNAAPTALNLDSTDVDEGGPTGTLVGNFSTVDQFDDTAAYTFVSGPGSTDNGAFTLNGNQLLTGSIFNFSVKSSYAIRVRTTDSAGLFIEAAFTITVNDVNVAPVINTIGNRTTPEGTTISFTVGAVDQDVPADTLTFSLAGEIAPGTSINPNTGLFTWTPTDGLIQSAFITFRATDNGVPPLFSEETITITVTNVAPEGTFSYALAVPEGSTPEIGFIDIIDPSPEDIAAGMLFSYDFDNDGIYDLEITGSAVTQIPAQYLPDGPAFLTVRAKMQDKDLADSLEYFAVMEIQNVAPTALFSKADDDPSILRAVKFTNQFDPSPIDTAAGFTYSYSFDGDLTWELVTTSATVDIPAQYLTSVNATVIGRITDKDGGYTDYHLRMPQFSSDLYQVTGEMGELFAFTVFADGEPVPTYTIEAVDLPAGKTLADLGLNFDGVNLISGNLFFSGQVTIILRATNDAGFDTANLMIYSRLSRSSNYPQIISKPTANPNPVLINTAVEFTAVATDKDGDILSYHWDFGDGSAENINNRKLNTSHSYAAPGTYTVTLVVSDGKKTQDDRVFVTVYGIDQNNFAITKAQITFDFRKPEKSQMQYVGKVPVLPGFAPLGTQVDVSIDGTTYAQTFILDAKGVAGDAISKLTLVAAVKGATGTSAKFTLHVKSVAAPVEETLFSKLAPLGFKNKTVKPPELITVPLIVKVGANNPVTLEIPMSYTAALNKTGKAKLAPQK